MIYISWFIDIGLYLEDYLMNKAVTLAGGIREPLLTCSSSKTGYFHSMGAVGTGNTLKLKKWHNANFRYTDFCMAQEKPVTFVSHCKW